LETQLGQLAKKVEEKFEKNFTTNTKVNPSERCNAIITRNGNVYEEKEKKKEEEKDNGENAMMHKYDTCIGYDTYLTR